MDRLLEVQNKALEAAKNHRGFAYWLEMGMGKTLIALAEFQRLVDDKDTTRLVVVAPNSFKSGWLAEIQKHGFDFDVHIYESGGDNARWLTKKYEKPPVLIVNYEAIRKEGTQNEILKFIAPKRAMIVFDESISIKTHNSQQTRAAIMLARYFTYCRILSGRPQTQGPHDLWGQMRAIGQLAGYNYFAWRNSFCRMGGYMNKKIIGVQNEEYLGKLLDPHVFRATKAEWMDLPPKLYTTRQCEMEGKQAQQYRTMEKDFITWLTETENVTVDMAITRFIKLAQIQFGFLIDEAGTTHELVPPNKNPRINIVKEILEEIKGKLAVVYHHRYAGEVLLAALAEYDPAYIRGNMTPEEIANNRDAFNNDPRCRVICLQDTAGRYGHTLVGGTTEEMRCSTMIFTENSWSLDTRTQIEDRIHRIGQKGDSCLYIDVVSSSLDRRIVQALQFKQSIFDAVMQHVGKNGAA